MQQLYFVGIALSDVDSCMGVEFQAGRRGVEKAPETKDGGTMIMLMVTGILVGAVLGLRFKVLVVVPVICVEVAIVLVDGIARENGAWWIALAMIAIVTSTQVGYFTGNIIRPVTTTRIAADGDVSMPRSAGLPGSV